VIGAIAFPSN
jgi:hypothetical protein